MLQVRPGPTFAEASVATGGALSRAVVGVAQTFHISSRDEQHNARSHDPRPAASLPPDMWRVVLTRTSAGTAAGTPLAGAAAATKVVGTVERRKLASGRGGEYTATYTLREAGTYSMAVTLRGKQLVGSPFTVFGNPDQPHATRTVAVGPGVRAVNTGA